MRTQSLIALVLVFLLVGCVSPFGSQSTPQTAPSESSPTAQSPSPTPTLNLPVGIESDDVKMFGSLSQDARDGIQRAQNSSDWVIVDRTVSNELGDSGYIYADSRVWEFRFHTGTKMVDVEPVNASDGERVTEYETLVDSQQRLFQHALNQSGPHKVGPDEEFVDLPATIEYQNKTYSVSIGTSGFGAGGGLDIDPYEK